MKRRVKIINSNYDEKRDLVKFTIKNLTDEKESFLVFPGEDLGSFVGQILGEEKNIAKEHRKIICSKLISIEFNHIIEADIKEENLKDFKEPTIEKMQHYHNIMNKYPYKEVLESMEDEEEK